ncbi:MAG TPA: C45 family peptidase [Blastocatellia bacterium]|nr:C45 family peptidase [Blastocatellia bacterium]
MLQNTGRVAAAFVIAAALLLAANWPKAAAQNDAKADPLAKAMRTERNGWIYLHLEGTPDEVGYQHGWLLAREIEDALRVFKKYLQRVTAHDWQFYRNAAHEMFWGKLDDEYKREIQGIARGAYARGIRIDADDVLAMNGWMELAWYYVPSLTQGRIDDPELHQSPPLACSAFVATGSYTRNGDIVIAHNNWIDYLIGRHWNIMIDLKPAAGHRILMDSFPGFIHSGDDFYVTDAGLMATETTISDFKGFDPAGLPEFYRIRKATQYADSIDDWLKVMMDRSNGGYANDWLIGDRKTGEIARLENGLKNNVVERTKDGYFIGSNFPVHEKTIKEETSFNPKDETNGCNARRRRWEELMKENRGKIDVSLAKRFLADHYDSARKRNAGSANTLCGHVELDDKGASADWRSFYPAGASNAKATDSKLATEMKLWAAVGHACGTDFKLDAFLKAHPEYEWQRELAGDLPSGNWTLFATVTPATGANVRGRKPVGTQIETPYPNDARNRRRGPLEDPTATPGGTRPPLR